MTEQQTSPVLFLDGPIVGEWRNLPVEQYGGYWVDNVESDGTTCYQPWQVRVTLGSTDRIVRVAYSDFHDDMPSLTMRYLRTPEAAKVFPEEQA